MRRRVLLCFVLALASGCQGDDATKPKTASAPPPPSQIISDGNHSGNPDFFFLPPMVANPSGSPNWVAAGFDGSYVGARAPLVTVCLLSASSELQVPTATCTGDPVVSAPAAVDLGNQQYQLDWRVPDVSTTAFYRVAVALLGNQIGIADVEVVPNMSQLKNVKTLDVVPLADNRTLPIKFRIQHNVLCNASMPPGFCSMPVDLSTGGTVQTTLPGGILPSGVTIPPGAGASTVNIAVQGCDSFRYRATDLPVFGPCVRITSTPILPPAGLTAAATVFVCDVSKLSVSGEVADEAQAERISLHQLDPDPTDPSGQVLRALPHADACGGGGISSRTDASVSRLFAALRHLDVRDAARQAMALLAPKPLYAAHFIDLGGGGSTAFFSDFQFALPASMQIVKSTNDQDADPGQMLPSSVSVLVTDLGGEPVRNARVTFAVASGGGAVTPVGPSETCPAASSCAVALTGTDGLASGTWTLGATQGANSLRAIGRGIAGDDPNNGPRDGVDPFQPIQSHFDGFNPPGGVTPVVVKTGSVLFSAFGWREATVCSDPKIQVVSGPVVPADNPSFVTPGPSFAITPNQAYAAPISGSVWIGPVANSGTTNLVPGTYTFRTSVFASHTAVLSGNIMADNGAIVLLNSQNIFQMGAWNQNIDPPTSAFQQTWPFSAGSGFVDGSNTLEFQLVNTGFSIGNSDPNPTALNFCISVSRPHAAGVPSN